MRVFSRMTEQSIETILEILRNCMLQPFGLGIDLIESITQGTYQKELK